MSELVAVYGTLRRGARNAGALAEARFLGGTRLPGFRLLHFGAYPGAVPGPGEITVEVYALPEPEMLIALDHLEGAMERPPLFLRARIPTPFGAAWIYLWARDPAAAPVIPNGDWLSASGAR